MVILYRVPALERLQRILDAIVVSAAGLTFNEIVRACDGNKSSVFSALKHLEAINWIQRGPDNKYIIGLRLFEIGSHYLDSVGFVDGLHQVAKDLVAKVGETVQIGILEGTEVVYLAKQEASHPVRLVSRIGSRLPAHCSGLGKAMLAMLSDDEVSRRYADGVMAKLTRHTISDIGTLLDELREIRSRGYAIDNRETSLELQCVAVARSFANAPQAAISISVPTSRGTLEQLLGYVPSLQTAVDSLKPVFSLASET